MSTTIFNLGVSVDIKTHVRYLVLIFVQVITMIVLIYALNHKSVVEFNTKICDSITVFGSPARSNNLEGYFGRSYVGPRIWHQINKDIWIEIYRDQNMFHLYHKKQRIKINKCEGDVLKRTEIQKMQDEVELFQFKTPLADSLLIFMPDNVDCSPLMSGNEGSNVWKEVYPLHK